MGNAGGPQVTETQETNDSTDVETEEPKIEIAVIEEVEELDFPETSLAVTQETFVQQIVGPVPPVSDGLTSEAIRVITVIRAQLSGLATGAFGESQPLGVSASSGARLSGTTVVKADNLSNGLGGLVGGSVQSQASTQTNGASQEDSGSSSLLDDGENDDA